MGARAAGGTGRPRAVRRGGVRTRQRAPATGVLGWRVSPGSRPRWQAVAARGQRIVAVRRQWVVAVRSQHEERVPVGGGELRVPEPWLGARQRRRVRLVRATAGHQRRRRPLGHAAGPAGAARVLHPAGRRGDRPGLRQLLGRVLVRAGPAGHARRRALLGQAAAATGAGGADRRRPRVRADPAGTDRAGRAMAISGGRKPLAASAAAGGRRRAPQRLPGDEDVRRRRHRRAAAGGAHQRTGQPGPGRPLVGQ